MALSNAKHVSEHVIGDDTAGFLREKQEICVKIH